MVPRVEADLGRVPRHLEELAAATTVAQRSDVTNQARELLAMAHALRRHLDDGTIEQMRAGAAERDPVTA